MEGSWRARVGGLRGGIAAKVGLLDFKVLGRGWR